MPRSDPDRHQRTLFEFEYDEDRTARLIEESIRREVGEIGDDRTVAAVDRTGRTLRICLDARDLIGLRAGMNTWLSLVEVAERSIVAGDG